MIKKVFDDGCLGVRLSAEEARDERALLSNLRNISPLTPSDTEILVNNIYAKEQDTKLFPEPGYIVGWKRSPTMSYVVLVFCPIHKESTEWMMRSMISSQVERNKSMTQALQEAAKNYVANAQATAPVHITKLDEYLNWYIPQIESFVLDNIKKAGLTYFEKSEAGLEARINNAIATAKKTKELAAQRRAKKKLGGVVEESNKHMSKNEDNLMR